MNNSDLLLAEIMKRTEEESMLQHYPQRFIDWWEAYKKFDTEQQEIVD